MPLALRNHPKTRNWNNRSLCNLMKTNQHTYMYVRVAPPLRPKETSNTAQVKTVHLRRHFLMRSKPVRWEANNKALRSRN
eukprot:762207-Amphidinium_carterae.1